MAKLTSEVDSLRSENARLQNRNGILEKVLELKEGKEGQPRQPAPQAGQPAKSQQLRLGSTLLALWFS